MCGHKVINYERRFQGPSYHVNRIRDPYWIAFSQSQSRINKGIKFKADN